MARHVIAVILFLSLSVLTFVQFRLLLAGVRLEKQRFDIRTESALLAVADSLNLPNARSAALIERLKIGQVTNDTLLVQPVSDSLDVLLKQELRRRDVKAGFAFVITPIYSGQVLLADRAYQPGKFNFGRYRIPLGSHIISNCHFEPVLHFDVPNLFGYLLGELRGLIVPSVLCLLTILACFLLLLNILKKERQLNTIKNDFINNLTHELKTPAFSISLSSRLAKESLAKNEREKALNFLQLIENENNKIKTHVEKVLELASLESPRYNLQKTTVSIHSIIQDVSKAFAREIENNYGKLSLNLYADPDKADVDVEHLKNALQNLLDNSLKYSSDAPIIEISTQRRGKQILISVSDNGHGIDPVYQKMVFDKFFRIPGDGKKAKGFGLGLSYVMQIAKAHGGSVTVESELRQGATFTISLPV